MVTPEGGENSSRSAPRMFRKHLQGTLGCLFGAKGTLNYKGAVTFRDLFQFEFPKTAFERFFVD